jgi:hypothetical protein
LLKKVRVVIVCMVQSSLMSSSSAWRFFRIAISAVNQIEFQFSSRVILK